MVEFHEVSYAYPGASAPAVRGVGLVVRPGERVALVGANGSGKSTIARLANGSLVPCGGRVEVDGIGTAGEGARPREVARLVGFVRQDPTCQLVSSLVSDEVAFGPANLGLEPGEVRGRVEAALGTCGLSDLAGRGVDELSGGERQRLALAGVLAMHPGYLVLDEVTSQLDDGARESVRELVSSLASRGTGVLEVTHDLREVAAADVVVVVEAGSVGWVGSPRELVADEGLLKRAQLGGDGLSALLGLLAGEGYDPRDGVGPRSLLAFAAEHGLVDRVAHVLEVPERPSGPVSGEIGHRLELRDASVSYGDVRALDAVTLRCRPGRVTLVAGRSGSGKTTAARALAGVLRLDRGSAELDGAPVVPGTVGLGFQRAEDQLFCDTVADDVAFGPRNMGLPEAEAAERAAGAMAALGLSAGLADRSPLALSGGQRRRVALAGIVALAPGAYVLDEPTVGLDASGRAFLRGLVARLAATGAAVAVVSHDLEEWLPVADDAIFLDHGGVAWAGVAAAFVDDVAPYASAGMVPPATVAVRAALSGGGPR